MHTPDFGKTPTEKTEIFIAYDNEYLYVAGRLYDREPSKIMASSKKRDDLAPTNDWFGVVIDTFNDKENGLCFFTSPTGLRLDMTVANDAQTDSPDGVPMNISWNTFWDVVTVRNERGWFAEFRIPFSSLRFQDKDGDVVMGLIAWRWIARKNETIIFPAFPPNWNWSMFKPSQAKEIVLSGIQSRKPLYIAPYILGGYGQTFDLNDQETAYQKTNDPVFEAGLDIKYGLTSNLTLDISLNTDFAQVEADDQQVNLTRFSLFFPEKRLFFQERSSTFDFSFGGPNRLFYSRQIGIYDETPVRIYGGVRLIGRVGAWDLGLMSMQTAPVKDEDLPSENFVVARLRRRVFNPFSYVGGIVTSRIGMDGTYNVAYGLDGIFRLFGDDYLKINWAQTFEDDKKNKLFSLEPARLTVGWQRRNIKGFSYDLSYSYCGELYNPEMGFEIRENYTHFGNRIQYGWIPGENAKLMNHNIFLQGFVFISNDDKSVESLEIGPGWSYSTKVGAFGNINFKYFYEDVSEGFLFYEEDDEDEEPEDPDVPVGQYRFFGLDATYATPWNRQVAFLTNLYAGTFYDGWRTSLSLIPRWCISSSFELSGTYQFNWI